MTKLKRHSIIKDLNLLKINSLKHYRILYGLSFLFLVLTESAVAQQLPIFTQYRSNRGYINPAAFEIEDIIRNRVNLSFGVSNRSQWVGLKGGPKTQTLHGTFASGNDGLSFLGGAHIIQDKADRISFTGFSARIGGLLTSDIDRAGIAAGLTFGGVQYRVNLKNADPQDTGDLLALENQSVWYPDVGVGVFGYSSLRDEDILYAGLSIPQVLGLDLSIRNENNEFNLTRVRHYYGVLGYYLDMNDEVSFLEASAWVKYVPNVPVNFDFNLRYQIRDILWIGGGYGNSKTVHFEAGFRLADNVGLENTLIKIGYGYDQPFSKISNFFNNTHEINITFYIDTHR